MCSSEFGGNFVKEGEPTYRGHRKDRRVILNCVQCGKDFSACYSNAKRTRQQTCSNQCGGVITRKNTNFISENHPLYSVWLSMKDRCNNQNNLRYPRYGGRGIKVLSEFNNFNVFLSYVSTLVNYPYNENIKLDRSLSLDRIDSNLGYEIGNLRWADSSTQTANKTWKKPNTSSKHIGVSYCTTNKAWIAKLQWQGKLHRLYYGKSEEEAYAARKAFILENKLPHHC